MFDIDDDCPTKCPSCFNYDQCDPDCIALWLAEVGPCPEDDPTLSPDRE